MTLVIMSGLQHVAGSFIDMLATVHLHNKTMAILPFSQSGLTDSYLSD